MNIQQKFVWLSDIHLNFLDADSRLTFYGSILKLEPEFVLISGDIAEADTVCDILEECSSKLECPIYFVLGNHDYYRGSIEAVRHTIKSLCRKNENLCWLGDIDKINLTEDMVLVGQDGWADARYGDYDNSYVMLNDSRLIHEFYQARIIGKQALKETMQHFADADANLLNQSINDVIDQGFKKIIVLTHVHPFLEICWHLDIPSDPDWTPFFASKVTGDIILNQAKTHQNVEFLVLCGHTHTAKSCTILNNLSAFAASADYFNPEIQTLNSLPYFS